MDTSSPERYAFYAVSFLTIVNIIILSSLTKSYLISLGRKKHESRWAYSKTLFPMRWRATIYKLTFFSGFFAVSAGFYSLYMKQDGVFWELLYHLAFLVPLFIMFYQWGRVGKYKRDFCNKCKASEYNLVRYYDTKEKTKKVGEKEIGGWYDRSTVDVKDSSGSYVGTAEVQGSYNSGYSKDITQKETTKIYKCYACFRRIKGKTKKRKSY
jgi:hypothetical protein